MESSQRVKESSDVTLWLNYSRDLSVKKRGFLGWKKSLFSTLKRDEKVVTFRGQKWHQKGYQKGGQNRGLKWPLERGLWGPLRHQGRSSNRREVVTSGVPADFEKNVFFVSCFGLFTFDTFHSAITCKTRFEHVCRFCDKNTMFTFWTGSFHSAITYKPWSHCEQSCDVVTFRHFFRGIYFFSDFHGFSKIDQFRSSLKGS